MTQHISDSEQQSLSECDAFDLLDSILEQPEQLQNAVTLKYLRERNEELKNGGE